MSFPYNPSVPNPPNNPSQDVGDMHTNAGTINSWVQVDHVGFNNSQGGQHKQITYQNAGSTPYTVAAFQSYEYTKVLQTARTYIEYQPAGGETPPASAGFISGPAIVPISFKAYAVFVPGGGVGVILDSLYRRRFNVKDITSSHAGPGTLFVVRFNEDMIDNFYFTFCSVQNQANFIIYPYAQSASQLTIAVNSNATLSMDYIGFGVL